MPEAHSPHRRPPAGSCAPPTCSLSQPRTAAPPTPLDGCRIESPIVKLNVDFRRYQILGACNPPLAHQALEANLDVGLMLPCNVIIVYEGDDGRAVVSAVDPMQTPAAQQDIRIRGVAEAVRAKLEKVLARLE